MLPLRPVQTERWMPAAPPRPAAGGHTGGNARGMPGGCQANAGGADHTQQAQAECGPFERWFAHDSAPFILHLLSAHRLCAMVRRFVVCSTPDAVSLTRCRMAAHILTLARVRRRSVDTGVDTDAAARPGRVSTLRRALPGVSVP